MDEEQRASLLLGPASHEWSATVQKLLARWCVVERAETRDDFLKRIRHTAPRVIVLYDTDERGTPNEPLLRHCARFCPASVVIFVHPGPALRMPSAWSLGPRRVRFVMLGGKSRREDAARLAEQVADAVAGAPVGSGE